MNYRDEFDLPLAGPDCAAFAPLLPLAQQGILEPTDRAMLDAHAAGCAHCRAALAAFDQLDAALRRYVLATTAMPPAPEFLVRSALAQAPATASTSDVMEQPMQRQTVPAAVLRRGRTLVASISSFAAVVALALVAALIFSTLHSNNMAGKVPHKTPTAQSTPTTKSTPIPVARVQVDAFTSVSFATPTDGWAVGKHAVLNTSSQNNSIVDGGLIFYHFTNGAWQPVSVPLFAHQVVGLVRISMVAPDDGWAIVQANPGGVLHYDGTSWQMANFPALGDQEAPFLIQMLSRTDGWIVTEVGDVGGGVRIWHYDGTHWTAQPLPAISGFSPQSISMLSANDGWLVGFGSGATAPPYQGVVLRYHQGSWSVQQSIPNFQFTDVSVDSMTDGWATGFKQYADSTGIVHLQYTLLHYANGTWSPSNAVSAQPDSESFTQIQMLSPTTGWLSKVVTARGGVDTTMLYRFDGNRWTLQHTFTSVSNGDNWVPSAFTFLGQTGWYVGAYTIPGNKLVITSSEKLAIYQYQNGQWTAILPEG